MMLFFGSATQLCVYCLLHENNEKKVSGWKFYGEFLLILGALAREHITSIFPSRL